MSQFLEVIVYDENDKERIAIVSDWTYKAARAAWSSPGEYLDNPPESAELDNIGVAWSDSKKPLSSAEWNRYGSTIEEAILTHIESEAEYGEDVDGDPL